MGSAYPPGVFAGYPTHSQHDNKRVERSYLKYASVGIQFAAAILIFAFAGIWLDEKTGWGPLFTMIGLVLGFTGATTSLYYRVYGAKGDETKTEEGSDKR